MTLDYNVHIESLKNLSLFKFIDCEQATFLTFFFHQVNLY